MRENTVIVLWGDLTVLAASVARVVAVKHTLFKESLRSPFESSHIPVCRPGMKTQFPGRNDLILFSHVMLDLTGFGPARKNHARRFP